MQIGLTRLATEGGWQQVNAYTAAVGAILLIHATFGQKMSLVSNGRGTDRRGKK